MDDLLDFSDECIVITGGASDVGRRIGIEFATQNGDVVVADIDDERGHDAVSEIEDYGEGRATFVHTDVSDLSDCETLVSDAVSAFGSVDVLVNTAAVAAPDQISKPFVDETPEDWRPQVDVTLMGTVNPTHAALPEMIDGGGGAVVNFSSEAHRGQDDRVAMYAAAKAGVATFTKSLAKEVGTHDVRVNAVSPSTTRTAATESWLDQYGDSVLENHALGRLGDPADHAYATLFLASDAADWITGQVLAVNGGYH